MKKILLVYTLFIMGSLSANAQVVVKPFTFPPMCQAGDFVLQTGSFVIKETVVGAFAEEFWRAYEIEIPNGYELGNYGTWNIAAYGADISTSNLGTFSGNNLIFTISVATASMTSIDSIVITGLQIRATTSAATSAPLYRITSTYPTGNHIQNGNMAANNLPHGTLTSVPNPAPTITYTPDPYYCNRENVNNTLTATPLGGTWSGAGVTGNLFNAFMIPASINTLTYSVLNGGLCTNQSILDVLVKTSPTVSISSNDADNTICPLQSVTFTGTSTGSGKRYQFYKNNIPATALSTSPLYTTTALNDGDQIMVVSDNGNLTCPDTSSVITMTVIANPNPTVSVSGLPSLVCSNTAGSFSILTSPVGGTLTGNGVSGSNFSPSTARAGNQVITYTMVVSGCSFPATTPVNVVAAPTVLFTSSDADNIICEGDAITFTANTSGTANRYLFLKNTNGIQGPNITNSYTASNISNGDIISVTVDNGVATCPTTSTGITTTVGKIPMASYTWENNCGTNNVNFTNISTISGSSIISLNEWDFDNNTIIDNTTLSPTNIYPAASTYYSRLTVTTDKGCVDDTLIRVFTLPSFSPNTANPYQVNFASSNQGWSYDNTTNPSWGWGTSAGAINTSGRNVWVTGLSGSYNINEHSYLNSPCFDFTGLTKPMIMLKIWLQTDVNAGAILEASTDNGNTWTQIGKKGDGLNWYDDIGNNGVDNFPEALSTSDAWMSNYGGWRTAKIGLQSLAGQSTVKLRIAFGSSTATQLNAGMAIDSVWIGDRQKLVVLEHFTTASNLCTGIGCPRADDSVNTIYNNRPLDLAAIHLHTSFPYADNFNTQNPADPSSRVLYYGISYDPHTILDGRTNYAKNLYGPDFILNDGIDSLDVSDIDRASLKDVYFDIDMTNNFSASTMQTNVKITAKENFSGYLVLQTHIIEDTIYNNTNSKNYYHVMRKMLPDAAGDFISKTWIKGDALYYSHSWNYRLSDGSYISPANRNNLRVVSYVQNYSSKEIYQAAQKKGNGNSGTIVVVASNRDINSDNVREIEIYPNPASDIISIDFKFPITANCKWVLLDNIGTPIRNGEFEKGEQIGKLETEGLNNNLYYLSISDEKGIVINKKILIIK